MGECWGILLLGSLKKGVWFYVIVNCFGWGCLEYLWVWPRLCLVQHRGSGLLVFFMSLICISEQLLYGVEVLRLERIETVCSYSLLRSDLDSRTLVAFNVPESLYLRTMQFSC